MRLWLYLLNSVSYSLVCKIQVVNWCYRKEIKRNIIAENKSLNNILIIKNKNKVSQMKKIVKKGYKF
ncbi:MAG: hypothetical protein KAX49_19885, partial [Halanaerobiales bacterium]|nr:hypothetical protein [Halanaerobiales bacterium]